jgi:hypothetical protein
MHNVVHVGDLGHIQVPRNLVEGPSIDAGTVENEGHGGRDAGGDAGELGTGKVAVRQLSSSVIRVINAISGTKPRLISLY